MDRYARQYNIQFGPTGRRADLMGWDWLDRGVVAEAKGRSRGVTADLRRTLTEQKRSISKINGSPPWLALGCVAAFRRPSGALRVEAFDPKKDAEEAVDLDVPRDQFMLAYYLPFLRAFDTGRLEIGDVFQTAVLE